MYGLKMLITLQCFLHLSKVFKNMLNEFLTAIVRFPVIRISAYFILGLFYGGIIQYKWNP